MTREMSEPHTDAEREELREQIARVAAKANDCDAGAGFCSIEIAIADALLASEQFTITAGARTPTLPAGADDEFEQVGTWLLPEAYGQDYDHFTQTRMATKPGVCIAVYAKRSDLAAGDRPPAEREGT